MLWTDNLPSFFLSILIKSRKLTFILPRLGFFVSPVPYGNNACIEHCGIPPQVELQGWVTGDGRKGAAVGVGSFKKSSYSCSTTGSEFTIVAILAPLHDEIDGDRRLAFPWWTASSRATIRAIVVCSGLRHVLHGGPFLCAPSPAKLSPSAWIFYSCWQLLLEQPRVVDGVSCTLEVVSVIRST